jgi:ribosomal protein S18 acetylase RimI-like enzyme
MSPTGSALAVTLRPARRLDAGFARRLYFETNRRIVESLIGWDERRERDRFDAEFRPEDAQIVELGGMAIGWLQAGEVDGVLQLRQICIDPAHQRRGIGGKLLRELVAAADAKGLPVELTVAHINPAVELYKRLGFRVAETHEYEFTMRRAPGAGG